jgi:iron complex transport system substrate-binding protein
MRICSLLPSATEIVCALGLEDSLVGISHECDYPPTVRAKPALIRPRVDPSAPAAEIDRQVREVIGRGESLYAVDADLLLRLEPDLILTQDLCHVCAASPDDLAAVLARAPRPPRVLSLSPSSLRDVWANIRAVGQATGRLHEAENLARHLEARCSGGFTPPSSPRPRVICLEWLSPLYVAGHWVPEMVELAGGTDVLGRAGNPSFCVSWDQVIAANPDVVVIMPCGYNLEKARREFTELPKPEGWSSLSCVHNGRVFAVDANSYFSRPGPRLSDGVELLASILRTQSSDATTAHTSLQADALAVCLKFP